MEYKITYDQNIVNFCIERKYRFHISMLIKSMLLLFYAIQKYNIYDNITLM